MQTNSTYATVSSSTVDDTATQATPTWSSLVEELLARAARLCVEHGVDLDDWMKTCWTAYVESRPGLRAHLEEMQLLAQLDELRKGGNMGQA